MFVFNKENSKNMKRYLISNRPKQKWRASEKGKKGLMFKYLVSFSNEWQATGFFQSRSSSSAAS